MFDLSHLWLQLLFSVRKCEIPEYFKKEIMIRRGEKCKKCGQRHLRDVAVDAVVVQDKKILLIKRGNKPDKAKWALPGGLLEWDESTEEAVVRELQEETGLVGSLGRFIGVYSNPKRDDHQRVTIVYEVIVQEDDLEAGGDAEDARWFSVFGLPELAADHNKIVEDYLKIRGN